MNLERIPLSGERTTTPTVRTARDVIPAMMRDDLFQVLEAESETVFPQETCECDFDFSVFFIAFIGGEVNKVSQ